MKKPILITKPPEGPGRGLIRLVGGRAATASALDNLHALNPARRYLDTLSPGSRRAGRVCLLRVARALRVPFDAVPWELLRASHIESLRARMQDARLSSSSINGTLAALKGVARQAFALRMLAAEEYQLIREVRGVRGSRTQAGRALAVTEVAALLDACVRDPCRAAGARDAALVALLAGAGLRRAEAVSLRVEDYRARSHALRVHGKGDKERVVYFDDGGARKALLAWLEVRGAEPGPMLTPVDRAGHVQVRHLTGEAVYKALRKRAREASVTRRFSPHSLRRFFATRLLDEGAGLGEVSGLLGHASVVTTAIYDRRGERARREASRLISLPYRGASGRRRRKRRKRRRRS
ncbi:MAG TPA: tyrosine-type recombinase/integrase [Pyrinomonadaceae bacterium]|jgi:site-specific recombinase XerD|nr:tyrosine-type recombinase/integrase [Pyrinomonadaceae bacterium]